jgi:hypothetical protein
MRHGPRWVRGWTATREGTDPLRELVLLLLVEVVAGELALELLDSAGGVDARALAGLEGVRAGPHFDVHLRNRGADRHDDVASEVDLALGVVLGVDLVLHGTLQGSGRGRPKPSEWSGSGTLRRIEKYTERLIPSKRWEPENRS